jgi:hypothetical protein
MPNLGLGSPMLGLSVFIHIMAILLSRILRWTGWTGGKASERMRMPRTLTFATGYFIMVCVFFIMMTSAATLVMVCILEPHSNLAVVEEALPHNALANAKAHIEADSVMPELTSLNRMRQDPVAYQIFLILALVGVVALIGYANSIVQYITYLNRLLPYRAFFVGVGIVAFSAGVVSLIMLALPIHATAAFVVATMYRY